MFYIQIKFGKFLIDAKIMYIVMNYKKFLALTSFFVSVLFLSPNTPYVHAQNGAGITLVPAMIEEAAEPGAVISQTLQVTNESDTERDFYVYKRNIKGVEAGGVPIFAEEAEKTGFEIADWLEFQTDPIKVPANTTLDFPLTIKVPENATPGSHFGGIFISAEPPKLREIGAGVGYEVASIVSIRIKGDISDEARIRSFSTDKLFYSAKDVNFVAKVENQGNILIRPRGPVSITSMFGSEPEIIMVNDSAAGVFPGSVRDFEFDWKSEGIGFGRYKAVLALGYDGEIGQKTIDATLVFWVFPTKLMLTLIAVVLGIFGAGYALTRYYINRAILHASGSRRISSQRYRKQVGISRLTFMFISLMTVIILLLLVLFIFFA